MWCRLVNESEVVGFLLVFESVVVGMVMIWLLMMICGLFEVVM